MMLSQEFYRRRDVVKIARELLGKHLITNVQGVVTGGMIVETEAYSWQERGCHAYGGKKTARNEIMFSAGGVAYVYLCYGMHNLFNVVTNREGFADAVLIRALEPTLGLEAMRQRRGQLKNPFYLTSGPGKLTRALGIDRSWNGLSLMEQSIRIETNGVSVSQKNINVSKRIGIDYAGTDANLPWRFSLKDNPWVSRSG
jgi:DNA-3-methyladenine glycosylase